VGYDLDQKVDEIDLKIIRLLQEDSRSSFNKIAANLGIAVGTLHSRVKNLEDEGILKGYTAIVDPNKLGLSLTALILIQADGRYLPEVEKELAKLYDVISIYDITGNYDIAITARFKEGAMLDNFIKNILRMPHVNKTVTNVVLNVIKEDFRVKV
jgi:Lrp/AsnC family transcriptional regulator for asnA, asnC and gidA